MEFDDLSILLSLQNTALHLADTVCHPDAVTRLRSSDKQEIRTREQKERKSTGRCHANRIESTACYYEPQKVRNR